MDITWEEGSEIAVRIDDGAVTVSANTAGLRSLAGILQNLADGAEGDHLHLDENNALEDGSAELIIEKVQ